MSISHTVYRVFLVCSDISLAASDADTYLDMRRSVINPAMQQQAGYRGLALLKSRSTGDHIRFTLLTWWTGAEEQRRWADAANHKAMIARLNHLGRLGAPSFYEQIEDLSTIVGNPMTATMCSIGYHRAQSGRGDDYVAIRRKLANPGLAKAAGFVGAAIGRDLSTEDRFLVLFGWTKDAKADEYAKSAEHVDVIAPAVAGVLVELRPSTRFDVVMHDAHT